MGAAGPGISPTRNVSPRRRRAARSLLTGTLRPSLPGAWTGGQRSGCGGQRKCEGCSPPAGSPESTCSSLHPPVLMLSTPPRPPTTLGPGAAVGPGSRGRQAQRAQVSVGIAAVAAPTLLCLCWATWGDRRKGATAPAPGPALATGGLRLRSSTPGPQYPEPMARATQTNVTAKSRRPGQHLGANSGGPCSF